MNFWSIINIILNFLTLINSILTIIICLFLFLLIIIYYHQSDSVQLLLACHICLTLLISSIFLSSMALSSLLGYMSIIFEQYGNTTWCHWRGYLIHGMFCVLFDSYILQAIYRLFRVVLYRHKFLHNYFLYLFLILIQSIFSLLSISPVLIKKHVIYLPTEYYCQTPFTNLSAMMYLSIRLYLLPIVIIAIIYVYLVKHIRQRNFPLNQYYRRIKHNRRNLIIIKRILLMLIILILLGLPSLIFFIIYLFTGYLISITYRVGWLSVSFSLVFLTYMLIQLTRPLRKTLKNICQCCF